MEAFASRVEDAGPLGSAEPFVAVGGEEVDLHGLHVDGQDPERLYGIDAEEHAFGAAGVAEGGQVGSKAAGELDGGDGDESGVGVDRVDELLEGYASVVFGHRFELHAAWCEIHPGVDVGRELGGRGDDVVALMPRQAVGDEAKALAGVFAERNLLGRRVEQLSGEFADVVSAVIPLAVDRTAVLGLLGVATDSLGSPVRDRGNGGVVLEIEFACDRELITEVVDVHGWSAPFPGFARACRRDGQEATPGDGGSP